MTIKPINDNTSGLPTIVGDKAKHTQGAVGRVVFPERTYENVVVKDVIASFTDEYLDEYYVIDLPGRPDTWVLVEEFTAYDNKN